MYTLNCENGPIETRTYTDRASAEAGRERWGGTITATERNLATAPLPARRSRWGAGMAARGAEADADRHGFTGGDLVAIGGHVTAKASSAGVTGLPSPQEIATQQAGIARLATDAARRTVNAARTDALRWDVLHADMSRVWWRNADCLARFLRQDDFASSGVFIIRGYDARRARLTWTERRIVDDLEHELMRTASVMAYAEGRIDAITADQRAALAHIRQATYKARLAADPAALADRRAKDAARKRAARAAAKAAKQG